MQPVAGPMQRGHDDCVVLVEVGAEVKTVKPGQSAPASFCI
ncbi:hypothetical protein NX862_14365 [Rhodobacter sp. KR11]|nr:hypothetical protein [Rhodobacter sp. KR11]MCW1919941.1 hypothetical protein [Rhodobacter sp. KR11]